MQKKDFKRPKFSLDRSRRGDLARQIADGLRTAIETGYYRAGDILPPVRDLAEILEVSKGMAEQAIAKLREEGLVSPRPAVGSVVCSLDRRLWKGQVLVVIPPGGVAHYENEVCAILCDSLVTNGYLAITVTVSRDADGMMDFAFLEQMTRQHFDLVVQLHDKTEIANWLSARKIPFLRFTSDKKEKLPCGCVGAVRRSDDAASQALAEHCVEAGARDVLVATAWDSSPVLTALRKAGVRVKRLRIDVEHSMSGVLVAQRGFDAMKTWIAKMRERPLPDLLFFDDDFIASGALTAMLCAGVRIPDDVSFASLTNRTGSGSGIVFSVPITRMEIDSHEDGRIVADATLAYLKNGEFPSEIVVGPKYVRGDTFK